MVETTICSHQPLTINRPQPLANIQLILSIKKLLVPISNRKEKSELDEWR
jgi:hypothetical protein